MMFKVRSALIPCNLLAGHGGSELVIVYTTKSAASITFNVTSGSNRNSWPNLDRNIITSRYQIQRNEHIIEYAFAPELGNIPVHINYMDNGIPCVLNLKSTKINDRTL